MRSYSEYISTESYWFSKVPSHWERTKNKFILSLEKTVVGEIWTDFDLLTMGKGGVSIRNLDGGGKFPESFESYQEVNPNQLIFCLFDLDETPRTVGLSQIHGMITSAYDVFSCGNHVDPKFVYYFYQSIDDVKGLKPYYTGLRKVVRPDTFLGIDFYLPPLSEQKQISDYLDRKTQHIDDLIEKTERKIDLLKEQRSSLINQCVTKGLDPNVEMKDSGVEWIGEIPKGWDVKKIKYLGDIKSGDGITNTDLSDDGEIPVYGGNGIIGYYDEFNCSHTVVVIGRVGEKCGNIHLVDEKCWISDNSLILTLIDDTYYPWVSVCLNSRDLNKIRNQSSQPLITSTQVKNETIPFPSGHERDQISNHLDRETSKIDRMVDTETKRIELLKEYRQSLISNVVTGKIDVRDEVVQ